MGEVVVYVRPYTRSDGTRVRGHFRGLPANPKSGLGILFALLLVGGLAIWGNSSTASDNDASTTSPTWETLGFNVVQVNTSQDSDCAQHSYGNVKLFLQRNPCRNLHRTLLKADDGHGNIALIAYSITKMPTPESAMEFQRLVDSSGSGNITEMTHETPGYSHIQFSGRHYESDSDQHAIHIAEAESYIGNISSSTLSNLAQETVERG